MSKEKVINYTENDHALVNALRDSEGMTLAELREATGLDLKAGHITSAMKKGLIVKVGEREVIRPTTREVSTYIYVDSDVRNNEKGKAYNYTEGELKVLGAASGIDSPFTLAELAVAMGLEKLSSGSINGLVKKGNIAKGDPREIEASAKSTVGVYGIGNIPTDF